MKRIALALALFSVPALAAPTTDPSMCDVIRRDITNYTAAGRPCPCPYSLMRSGRACGDRSAWAKPDGETPRCYFQDVTGQFPPNHAPNKIRRTWPDQPPCMPTS